MEILADSAAMARGHVGFPAAPWVLQGVLHASVWRVPLRDLPFVAAPGARACTMMGQALIVTGWASYAPGGTLSYNEMLTALAVRVPSLFAPACTIGPIWVDSDASAIGGQSLWEIPKRMASFDTASRQLRPDGDFVATMRHNDSAVAAMHFEPGWSLPGRISLPLWTVQPGAAGPVRTRCTLAGRLRKGSARWDFSQGGPLAFLHGRTPLFSMRLEDLTASFGV